MSARRVPRLALALSVVALAALLAPSAATPAAPATLNAVAPPVGQSVTLNWTGTIAPQSTPTSDCNDSSTPDTVTVNYSEPPGLPDNAVVEATFKISWTPATPSSSTSDEILTVNSSSQEVGSSDGSGTSEIVTVPNIAPDRYQALACGYANAAPQDYTGTLTLTTRLPETSVPSSSNGGLQFSAAVPADPQRDESEPLMEIDPSGSIYTCGPTGFSNAADYAQVSTDGGDQFHLLGTPPRGQQGLGGGGDCGLATSYVKNAGGFFQYAYAGLGPLTGFTTSTSPDGGRTMYNAGPQGNTNTAKGGGADRQWLTFLDDTSQVLLSYNQQAPRNVVVQKSTDGGFSYLIGNDAVAAGNPDFPGPMRSMPASLVRPGATGRIAYFGWNTSDADYSYVNLSISDSTGLGWTDCLVQKIPLADSGGLQAFTVADNDNAGNLYLAYADKKAFHTYLTTLTADKVRNCDEPVDASTAVHTAAPPTKDPGWSAPVQVDRDSVRSTIFPWLVAGGAPGRVAVAYYGTESDGDPNPGTFKASWDVYVDQSVNALSPDRTFGQVKATTHPMHYDSICLQGLGCDLSTPPGDRTLGDFFALDYNPVTKRISVTFNRDNKKPDEATGHIGETDVVTQIAGPSNGGGTVGPDPARPPLRSSSADPSGDALSDYSALAAPPPGAGRGGQAKNEPAMDFLSARVGFEVTPATGQLVRNGGFTVTLKLADLSDAALQQALSDTSSQSLLWIFRFVNGYQASAAQARYDGSSFTFGFDDYTLASAQCGSDGDKCEVYPGATEIKGAVDQKAGTITLSVPRALLRTLTGPTGDGERPTESKAVPGTRFYDATAFSLGNPSPSGSNQSFMTPVDNTPAMDFLLPGVAAPGGVSGNAGSLVACKAAAGLRSASVRARGSRVTVSFRRSGRRKVSVDVFQVSHGREILNNRAVAHFSRARSFTWDGRANRRGRRVTDGIFYVRVAVRDAAGRLDSRRFALARAHGRFARRRPFERRESCSGTVRDAKLVRPAFGGRRNDAQYLSYRLTRLATVGVTVLEGGRVVKRFAALTRRAGVTYRLRFPSEGRATGDYRFVVRATSAGHSPASVTLTARRL